MALVALRQGWFRQKSAGWWWLWRHRREVAARRQWVQAARRVPDRDLLGLLTGDFAPGESTGLVLPRRCAPRRAATGLSPDACWPEVGSPAFPPTTPTTRETRT